MTINATAPYQTTTVYAKSTPMKTAATGERVFSVPEAVAAVQKDSSTVYEEISGKYDVRNATFGEVTEIADALYKAGEITLGEVAALTFDYDRATNSIKQHARMPILVCIRHQPTVTDKEIGLRRSEQGPQLTSSTATWSGIKSIRKFIRFCKNLILNKMRRLQGLNSICHRV